MNTTQKLFLHLFKIIIAGSRNFNNYSLLQSSVDNILCNYIEYDFEFVSGGARGADKLGERYAEEAGYIPKIFEADWGEFGKSAGYFRNTTMGNYADMLIAFPLGESKGTWHMINYMKKLGKIVYVV